MICAGQTVSMYPSSKIAKENMDVFIDVWTALIRDMSTVLSDVVDYYMHADPAMQYQRSRQHCRIVAGQQQHVNRPHLQRNVYHHGNSTTQQHNNVDDDPYYVATSQSRPRVRLPKLLHS